MILTLKGYKKYLRADIVAGITVAILLIPQAMGHALIAGIPPVYGLYTAMVPLLIYPLIGSSPHLSVGTAAVPSLLVFAMVSKFAEPFTDEYVQLTVTMAFLIGVFLILFHILRLGKLTRLISHPVILGYTMGAGILIFLSQIGNILKSQKFDDVNLWVRLQEMVTDLSAFHMVTMLMGLGSLLLMMLIKKLRKGFPYALVTVILSIIISWNLGLDKEGLEVVGNIREGIPAMKLPNLDTDVILQLLPSSLIIAFIVFVQSYAIAKVFSEKGNKETILPGRELLGIGAANLASAFSGGYPSTGSLTRSAVNFEAGSRTGISSLVAGSILAVVLIFFTSYFYFLPKTVLAAIIVIAVFNLIDIKEAKRIYQTNKLEFFVFLATFLISLFVGVEYGVMTGVIFSLLLLVVNLNKEKSSLKKIVNKDTFIKLDGESFVLQKPITYFNEEQAYKSISERLKDFPKIRGLHTNNQYIDITGQQTLTKILEEFNLEETS